MSCCRNGDINNHIAEHDLQTNHRIDWDSAKCITVLSTDHSGKLLYLLRTNAAQTLPMLLHASYKRLIDNIKKNQTNNRHLPKVDPRTFDYHKKTDRNAPITFLQSSQPMTSRLTDKQLITSRIRSPRN